MHVCVNECTYVRTYQVVLHVRVLCASHVSLCKEHPLTNLCHILLFLLTVCNDLCLYCQLTNLSCILLFLAAYDWICKCVLYTLVHIYCHSVGVVYMRTAKAFLTALCIYVLCGLCTLIDDNIVILVVALVE